MMAARALALAGTLSLALAAEVRAQAGSVALLVIDDATDAPVPDVRVSVLGQLGEGVTDARGRFLYASPHGGQVAFVLRRLGYLPGTLMVDVGAADTARVTFALTVAPQTLAAVSIRDTMTSTSPFLAGFERRARIRSGSTTYITRQEIANAHASRVTDLLRRTTSLSVVDSGDVQLVTSRRLARCPLQLAVDGELRYGGSQVNWLAPEEIYGIEVFPGPATVPAEYATMRGTTKCGLIMIWTRRDK